jgi:hypothetical protein
LTLGDFEFLSALLVIPEEDVAVAFKVFDKNGNGVVDVHEFRQVRDSILRVSAVSPIPCRHVLPYLRKQNLYMKYEI